MKIEKKDKILTSRERKPSENTDEFDYNMIKGRMAEALIEQLFISLGFKVFRYGMENTIPGIMELLKGDNEEVALNIRKMPDLVVYKGEHPHYIEVKFRADGRFELQDLEKDGEYPYHKALIVVVSTKHIKCLSYEELKDEKKITETGCNYLGYRKEFKTDAAKIKKYCEYATKFFSHVETKNSI